MDESVKLGWKVHTPNLLRELVECNSSGGAVVIPVRILLALLGRVATRASELNDPQLNALMVRLALYSIADPECADYDPEMVERICAVLEA